MVTRNGRNQDFPVSAGSFLAMVILYSTWTFIAMGHLCLSCPTKCFYPCISKQILLYKICVILCYNMCCYNYTCVCFMWALRKTPLVVVRVLMQAAIGAQHDLLSLWNQKSCGTIFNIYNHPVYCRIACMKIYYWLIDSLGNTSQHRDEMTPPLPEYSSILYYTKRFAAIPS